MAGLFGGLKDAPVFERGQYFEPGDYVVELKAVKSKETLEKGPAFIVEAKVLEAIGDGASPVGTDRNWFQSMKNKQIAFPEIKQFMYAALGRNYAKDPEGCKAAVDPMIEEAVTAAIEKNALAGRKLTLKVYHKITKANQKTFSVHVWGPAT